MNKQVADEEFKDHSGDPFFPKVQWPPPELCPLCRAPSVAAGAGQGGEPEAEPEWNEDEVYRFLVKYYGDAGEKADAASVAYFGGRQVHRCLSLKRDIQSLPGRQATCTDLCSAILA